ncbi:MAG: hypothetical protein AMJ95_03210 [Omnitrophica WOR_2 bacterium SM23_72]|nr:MAG: hypothetical protein AMJ95_03210 [Omnitrophica WOR_2 bacterium SM23_72]
MVGYLFAGQGSQYVGMGKDLFEAFPESKAVFDKADEILGFPLSKLCFEGPKEELTKTVNCQPAVLTMSLAVWEAFRLARSSELGARSYAAGLSLGEYSALVAAGALSFADAVYLVRKRGEFMEDEALKNPGRMLSIIGLKQQAVEEICRKTSAEIANLNCPGQIVISASPEHIEKAKELAKEKSASMAIVLEVNGAFHSSFMKGASARLAKELGNIQLKVPAMPVICNVTAKATTSVDEIRDNLIQQVASPVFWERSMRFLLSEGIMHFIEFGPGSVLKGLMRRIEPQAQVVNICKKEDIVNFRLS